MARRKKNRSLIWKSILVLCISSLVVYSLGKEDPSHDSTLELHGVAHRYTLQLPSKEWQAYNTEEVKKENPDIDRWIHQQGSTAQVMVIAEAFQGALDRMALIDQIIANGKRGMPSFDVLNVNVVDNTKEKFFARLEATATLNEVEYQYTYGIFVLGQQAYQVICVAQSTEFSTIQKEFEEMIASFHVPDDLSSGMR